MQTPTENIRGAVKSALLFRIVRSYRKDRHIKPVASN